MTGTTDDLLPGDDRTETNEPDRPMLALLLAYQRRAWRRGERAAVEEYLAQYPALAADREAVLDLIYQEVMLREQAGESPLLEEYRRRFPHLAPQLELQFEVEGALGPATPRTGGETTLRAGDCPRAVPDWSRSPCRPYPATRCWASWAAAAWGSSTRSVSSDSTGSPRSR